MKILTENNNKVNLKKKKNERGWFVKLNAGNPELNAAMFNHAMGTGDAEIGCSESFLVEEKANTYKITYIRRSDDRTAIEYIDAYSKKQAIFIFKKYNKDIFKIVSVDCIEDHSKDDGEQLSFI